MNLQLIFEFLFFFLLLFFMIHNEFIIETINTNQKKLGNFDYFKKIIIRLAHKYKYLLNNNNITDDCPIWVMYYKGIENSPPIVKDFIISIENNLGKHHLYKLDKYNYNKYIILPQFLLNKFNKKIFNISHF